MENKRHQDTAINLWLTQTLNAVLISKASGVIGVIIPGMIGKGLEQGQQRQEMAAISTPWNALRLSKEMADGGYRRYPQHSELH